MKSTTLMNSHLTHHFPPIHAKISPNSLSFTHTTIITTKCNPQALRNSSITSTRHKQHQTTLINSEQEEVNDRRRKLVITGVAASLGFMLIMMGHDKAWALGPEGPLVEEFWENVRRYALYALTVSTGVIYSVVQPIYELLRNPISAVLVLIIIGGTFFIGSQILSAMVGLSDFSYQYAY